MNHYVEESLDDVVHHVPGLDPSPNEHSDAIEENFMYRLPGIEADAVVCPRPGAGATRPKLPTERTVDHPGATK
jgi:hypothetical protein